MSIRFRKATEEDAKFIAEFLRECDREELEAMDDSSFEDSILFAMSLPGETAVLTVDDVPAAIFGVAESSPEVGHPWLLGTPELDRNPRVLLTEARTVVQNMMQQYKYLENYIYEGSTKNRRWVRWLGFNEDAPQPFGEKGKKFCKFHWRQPCAE